MILYFTATDADGFLIISQAEKIEVYRGEKRLCTIDNPKFMKKFTSLFTIKNYKLDINTRNSEEVFRLIFYVTDKKYYATILQIEGTSSKYMLPSPAHAHSLQVQEDQCWFETIKDKKVLVKMRNRYIKGLPEELFSILAEIEYGYRKPIGGGVLRPISLEQLNMGKKLVLIKFLV